MRSKLKIITVIPAYNEEQSISDVVKGVLEHKIISKCIVVSDGSTDKTAIIAKKSGAQVINLPRNSGAGRAIMHGIYKALKAGADIIITMDADGQHDSSHLQLLLSSFTSTTDLVIGSRYVSKTTETTTKIRALGTMIISTLINIRYKKKIYDVTSGYKVMSKRTAELILAREHIIFPEPEIIISLIENGFLIKEVSITMKHRAYGYSSINLTTACYLFAYILLKLITGKTR